MEDRSAMDDAFFWIEIGSIALIISNWMLTLRRLVFFAPAIIPLEMTLRLQVS